ncbi:phosphotransferase enzyme family protein [Paraliomyxa miuraensis]|uniref:phosphotransferase enzyme family protein n=1 Tax=Paraliomyxa miuraensis TaxID=376150 RepID=UPI002252CE64|nr:aminoglycoside phosphotransferase family protein [Paraliomyxa miuraensis]MCX4244915.1 aminoglycoside phosphotransferase family protein [Paraliomyxa miuraensis]
MSRSPATVAEAQELARAFGLHPHDVAPLGRGLINDTFAVESGEGSFVLQRVHPVFAPQIHDNIEAVTAHLHRRGMITPRLRSAPDGARWIERDGAVWRVLTRVSGVTFDAVASPAQAHAAAGLLARFHSALGDLEHRFVGLRSGVHDTPAHLRRLHEAVAEHREHRLYAPVARLAEAIGARATELPTIDALPSRVVHGDPKLNNVLFESAQSPGAERPVCLIDLDTVAPMPLPLELGDALRSWCNPRGEDEHEARFDLATHEATMSGYLGACTLSLRADEREALLHGVEWITLELSARFAADALHERYFGWDRARFPAAGEHNLVRARGQWSLHEQVLATRGAREAALAMAPRGG